MPFLTLEGVRTFYTDEGAGDPPLLFVHGLGCDSHDWSWQIARFSARRRVIAPDLRGHGRSGVPGKSYGPHQFARDMASLIRALKLGKAIVIGHSLGGIIASVLAIEHPDVVSAIVTVDAGHGQDRAGAASAAEFVRGLRERGIRAAVERVIEEEGPHTPMPLKTWHRRRTLGMPLHVLVEAAYEFHESRDAIVNLPGCDDYLRRRSVPVLSVNLDERQTEWERGTFSCEGSCAVAWHGVGHWLHQERPAEFNALLLTWLEGLKRVR